MDLDPTRLSALLQDVYASVLEPENRATLPCKIATAFNAHSCLLHTRSDGPAGVAIIGATDNCAAFLSEYPKTYHVRDVWHERGARYVNEALLGEDIVSEEELVRSDFYNDVCRWYEIHHLVGAVFGIDSGITGSIGIHRAPNAHSFAGGDRTTLNLLVPHLRQALRLMRIADADARAKQLSFDALTSLSVAVFVVSAERRVRMMNAAAEQVVRARTAIILQHGRLSLSDPTLDNRLHTAIKNAALAPLGQSFFAGETIVVRTSENGVLPIKIAPLPPNVASSGPLEPLAAVFVAETGCNQTPSLELVRAVYGLTPAETRLLLALVNGERTTDYAEKIGVSTNTVHTQMKSLFVKVDCHRQVELMHKIASDPMLRIKP